MRASVIISAYRSPRNIILVLHALARQRIFPDEVIIADDGSDPPISEGIQSVLAGLPFPVSQVWQPDEGFRAARSRNNAIYKARNDMLVLLDQDVLPHADWLETHLEAGGPGRACLARALPLDEEASSRLNPDVVKSGDFESWHPAAAHTELRKQQTKYQFYTCMRRLRLPFKKTRPALVSCNAGVWKPDLKKVNGFDEAYVGWGQEDDDLGRRLYMAGIRPVPLVTQARGSHIWHPACHTDWKEGPNLPRYRARLVSSRCQLGLDHHPHADVRHTLLKA